MGKVLDLTPVERADLVDCNAGDWAGTPLKDLAKKPEWPTVMHYPSGFCFPGGEAIRDMQARMVDAMHDLVNANPGKTVACCFARRPHQVGARRRAGRTPRPVPADSRVTRVGQRHKLRRHVAQRGAG